MGDEDDVPVDGRLLEGGAVPLFADLVDEGVEALRHLLRVPAHISYCTSHIRIRSREIIPTTRKCNGPLDRTQKDEGRAEKTYSPPGHPSLQISQLPPSPCSALIFRISGDGIPS